MKINLDNKGFTLVEVLAVIVIIAIIGGIAAPNILSTINNSKDASVKVLEDNIKTAAQQLYEEVEFLDDGLDGIEIYSSDGNSGSITVDLGTLVNYGFLKGSGDESNELIDPRTGNSILGCKITITKNADGDYSFENETGNAECPNYN